MQPPPTGQGPFQRGERLTAAKLNDVVNAIKPVSVFGYGHVEGDSVLVDERESMYVRLTGKAGSSPIKYAWKRVSRLDNGTWANLTHTGNTTSDYAVEINNENLAVNTTTVYKAHRSLTTAEWLIDDTAGGGGGGGNVTANSSETAIMILGTYDQYKDCPGVPPQPPTTITDFCNQTRSASTLCVPAYAYAVYQRCGYVWNKIGDTRTYQVWANEMNGGSASALRRFYIPRWGGDFDASTGLPDPEANCIGVAFLGYNSQSTLTCSCPTCLSSPPAGKCLRVKFQTMPRPAVSNECGQDVTHFDNEDLWDKEITIELSPIDCGVTNLDSTGTFNFSWQHIDGSSFGCDWGPETFDPCDPCAHWSRLDASIEVNENPNTNCGGSGHWKGEFLTKDICNLLCDCTDPVEAVLTTMCGGCGNNDPPIFYFIDESSVRIECYTC